MADQYDQMLEEARRQERAVFAGPGGTARYLFGRPVAPADFTTLQGILSLLNLTPDAPRPEENTIMQFFRSLLQPSGPETVRSGSPIPSLSGVPSGIGQAGLSGAWLHQLILRMLGQ